MNKRLLELFTYLVDRGYIKKPDMSVSAYDYDRLKEFETLITQTEPTDLEDIKSRLRDTLDDISSSISDLDTIIDELE